MGGVWEIRRQARESWIARAIAIAAAHPLGVGDAFIAIPPGWSGGYGAVWRVSPRRCSNSIGRFDENLLTNEDYEFNARLRGRVVEYGWIRHSLDLFCSPEPEGAGSAVLALRILEIAHAARYPQTLRWRQALPPLFVLSLLLLGLLSPWLAAARLLLAAEIVLYLIVLLAGTAKAALRQGKDARLLAGVPVAIATMHLTWGAGFLWSLLTAKTFLG